MIYVSLKELNSFLVCPSIIKTPQQLEIIILHSYFLHFATFKLFILFE